MKTLIVLLLFAVTSCRTYYYYPTYHFISSNTKKNEIKVEGFTNAENTGAALSYSIYNNVGTFLILNTFNGFEFNKGAQFLDFGIYYYDSHYFPNKKNIKTILSLSSAYGIGTNNRYNDDFSLYMKRFYIQPSFVLSSRFIDFGISERVSYLDYKIKGYNDLDNYDLKDIGRKPFIFSEPDLFVGVGYKWIKLNYHVTQLSKMNASHIEYFKENVRYLSLSININIKDDKIK